ncbi:MAG TPA: hypothetical protein VKU01_17850 [Bryobacteraceae bacterium]|nr:hypothetical protein [Bryobacteraceae bacterium]
MRTLLFVVSLTAAAQSYQPGVTYQTANPNYPVRNPFYFEGRVDWDLLRIDQPSNAWEFAQRGIHKQDDLEDFQGAMDDYRTALSMNSRVNGTCQILTSAPAGFGQTTDPPPCMFTVRLRLGNLLRWTNPEDAIALFKEVLEIDPLRLGVNALIGDTYAGMPDSAAHAIAAYKAELALSPVTDVSKAVTGDEANNAHVHWSLAGLYEKMGLAAEAVTELDLYLKATQWHSDTYPWRIELAKRRMTRLQSQSGTTEPRR